MGLRENVVAKTPALGHVHLRLAWEEYGDDSEFLQAAKTNPRFPWIENGGIPGEKLAEGINEALRGGSANFQMWNDTSKWVTELKGAGEEVLQSVRGSVKTSKMRPERAVVLASAIAAREAPGREETALGLCLDLCENLGAQSIDVLGALNQAVREENPQDLPAIRNEGARIAALIEKVRKGNPWLAGEGYCFGLENLDAASRTFLGRGIKDPASETRSQSAAGNTLAAALACAEAAGEVELDELEALIPAGHSAILARASQTLGENLALRLAVRIAEKGRTHSSEGAWASTWVAVAACRNGDNTAFLDLLGSLLEQGGFAWLPERIVGDVPMDLQSRIASVSPKGQLCGLEAWSLRMLTALRKETGSREAGRGFESALGAAGAETPAQVATSLGWTRPVEISPTEKKMPLWAKARGTVRHLHA